MRLLPLLLLAGGCAAQDGLEVAGVAAVPHVTSAETRYRGRANPEGAWVQIILRNPTNAALPAPSLVNGREAFQWLLAGEWAWADSPRLIPPGGYGVLSFNGVTPRWRPGADIVLESARRPWRAEARLPEAGLALTKISFLPARGVAAVHFWNRTGSEARLEKVILRHGAGFRQTAELAPLLSSGPAPPGERGAGLWHLPEIPLAYVLVEAQFNHRMSRWAMLRFKDDGFDIGAGWLDTPAPNGVNPLTVPAFRSLMRRLHINLVHAQHDPAPDGKPFRRMSTFADVKRFSAPDEAAAIHCADVVGEPQHSGLTPLEVFRKLKSYESGSYATCLTLSEDVGFGFYAGLSDWPHFDAYRVNAPHADDWTAYVRFGEPLAWGAPVETAGAMMRVLNEVSRPRPVAAWSQGAHYNWRTPMGGRQRLDPTPAELAGQAWQVVANGAQSLYWYSLESYSVLRSPDLLGPLAETGRRLRALQLVLETGDAIWHKRQEDFDLNVIAAPEAAVLFALDLAYRPDKESRTFVWDAPRRFDAEFELPHWLRGDGLEVMELTAAGLTPAGGRPTASGVRIRGAADVVSIHIAFRDKKIAAKIKEALEAARAHEAAQAFDPADADQLRALSEALGYRAAQARILR